MTKITRFNVSIVRAIADEGYRPSDEALVTLVQTKVKAGTVDEGIGDTYFGVLATESRDNYEKTGTVGTEAALAAVDEANKRLMVLVNRGAITPEIEANASDDSDTKRAKYEARQKRTGFARSSASVLRRWIKAGGDLSKIDPASMGKSTIDRAAKGAEQEAAEQAGENTPEAKVSKRLASLITALNQLEGEDKANFVAHCVATLNAI